MSQTAEKREHRTPSQLKDAAFDWEDPLVLESSSPKKSAWCATPRAPTARTS